MTLAVTRTDVLVTLHILGAVVAFGGALAYPLWFAMLRHGTPEQRASFHRAQARLAKFLITPSILVVFATGAYLASDLDVWGQGWVLIPMSFARQQTSGIRRDRVRSGAIWAMRAHSSGAYAAHVHPGRAGERSTPPWT